MHFLIICFLAAHSYLVAATPAFDDDAPLTKERVIAQVKAMAEARIAYYEQFLGFFQDDSIPVDQKISAAFSQTLTKKEKCKQKEICAFLTSDEESFVFGSIRELNADLEFYCNITRTDMKNPKNFFNIARSIFRRKKLQEYSSVSTINLFKTDLDDSSTVEDMLELMKPFFSIKEKLFFKHVIYSPDGKLRLWLNTEHIISLIKKTKEGRDLKRILHSHVVDLMETLKYHNIDLISNGFPVSEATIDAILTKFAKLHIAIDVINAELPKEAAQLSDTAPNAENTTTVSLPLPPQEAHSFTASLPAPSPLPLTPDDDSSVETAEESRPPEAPIVQKPKTQKYDPLRMASTTSRFDFRVTPSWILDLVQDRARVTYAEMEPTLKRLGKIKNNTGSLRTFTFHQTPSGKLTVIFFHEPHPDDGRGIQDPCYVKPIVNGFERAGYVW